MVNPIHKVLSKAKENSNKLAIKGAGAEISFESFHRMVVKVAALLRQQGVKPGDVVYDISAGTAATVVSVDSETQLTLNANIFTTGGQSFRIYQQSSQTGNGNTGCNLYIGGTGNVSVVTIGGDEITFNGVPAGTTLPVQVVKLTATGTTATLVNALW